MPEPVNFLKRLYLRVEKRFTQDVFFHMNLEATRDSARYALAHMRLAKPCRDRWQVLGEAADRAPRAGLVLEFGVATGRSVNFLARRMGREVHGFDSFEGLPEDWTQVDRKGAYTTGSRIPETEPQVRLHPGLFADTLPKFLETHPGPAALLHVDCDLYSSTRGALERVADRIVPGTVLVFDEYFNYPGWREHEWKAFAELVRERRIAYRYLGYHRRDAQASLVVEAVGAEDWGPRT